MILGTCSICGGSVEVPDGWYGVDPPIPTCRWCGAIKKDHGPVIEMKKTSFSDLERLKRLSEELYGYPGKWDSTIF